MDDATIFTMAKGATLDDLRRVDDKAELVGGEIVYMTPGGDEHPRASLRIGASLLAYEERTSRSYQQRSIEPSRLDRSHSHHGL